MAGAIYWEPKDPDETVNYAVDWATQLTVGDTVATSAFTEVVGAVLDAQGIAVDGLSTTAQVSGGADGVTASFLNTVITTLGETLEQIVLLPIVSNSAAPLGDYEMPRPQDLVARFPAFAAVPYGTIAIHLTDALSGVDTSWAVGDYAQAITALAAHNMALLGLDAASESTTYARNGVSSLRDGNFSVSFNDKSVSALCGGGFDASQYGRIYRTLLRRNKAGPRLVGGALSDAGWGPLAIQNNGLVLP